MLTEKDEFRHPHDNDLRWRESLYWGLVLPDASVGGLLYLRMDPNAGTANPLILIYRGFGEVAYSFTKEYALPAKFELDDVNFGRFQLRCLRPLSRCAITFTDDADMSLDFLFTGIHPPFDYARNRCGCPSYMATNRFEQAGRIEGELRFKGETFQLTGYAQRDHSWGTRDWGAIQHYKWISAQSLSGAVINLTYSVIRGEVVFNGYVYDGREVVCKQRDHPASTHRGRS